MICKNLNIIRAQNLNSPKNSFGGNNSNVWTPIINFSKTGAPKSNGKTNDVLGVHFRNMEMPNSNVLFAYRRRKNVKNSIICVTVDLLTP